MAVRTSRLIGVGLAAALVTSVAALTFAAINVRQTDGTAAPSALSGTVASVDPAAAPTAATGAGDARVQAQFAKAAERSRSQTPVPAPPAAKPDGKTQGQADAPRRDDERNVSVQTPYADVDVDKQRGKVRVRAPYTNVAVDPDRGRVRVRAPYVNLDIRW